MDWEMIAALSGIVFAFGCIMLAAAKSVFATKAEHSECTKVFNSKLYDKGITIFLPRKEWEANRDERERRRDLKHEELCEQMERVSASVDLIFQEIRGDIKKLIEKTSERRSSDPQ